MHECHTMVVCPRPFLACTMGCLGLRCPNLSGGAWGVLMSERSHALYDHVSCVSPSHFMSHLSEEHVNTC